MLHFEKRNGDKIDVPEYKTESFNMARSRVHEILHPTQCESRTFNFENHLTDNADLVPSIMGYVQHGPSNICLIAPCSAGKTYMIVHELERDAVKAGKKVIMTSPLAPLVEQTYKDAVATYPVGNAEGVTCEMLSGSSRSTDSSASFITAVFDSIHRLERLPEEELAKVIFVIDEAHDTVYAQSYRSAAIAKVQDFANKVTRAGGSIIYMTGTPRMIASKNFNAIFTCVKTADGKPVSPCLMKSICYARRTTNRGSNIDVLANQIVTDFTEKGLRSIVMIQSKKKIARLCRTLEGRGLSVGILRSDDKGWGINPETRQKEYRSQLYESLVEDATLLYRDVYLVTSVIEMGVSIKYVKDINGNPEQPEKMQMIYACMQASDYNIDAMIQFFARLRFTYERACIFGKSVGKVGVTNLREQWEYLMDAYIKAYNNASLFSTTGVDRAAARTADGKREDELLNVHYLDNAVFYLPCDDKVMREAYKNYDFQLYYRCVSTAEELIKKEFGIDNVTYEVWKADPKLKVAAYMPEPVSDAIKAELKNAIRDPYFRKAVSDPQRITENAHIDKIRALGGEHVLRTLGLLVMSRAFTTDQEITYAIEKAEDPSFRIEDENGRMIDPCLVARNNGYGLLAECERPEVVLNRISASYFGEPDAVALAPSEEKILALVSGTKSWQYFLDLTYDKKNFGRFDSSLIDIKKLCMTFSTLTADEAFAYRTREQYAFLNAVSVEAYSKKYILGNLKTSTVGKEYFVIRNAGNLEHGFQNEDNEPLFKNNDIRNKMIDKKILRAMAKDMNRVISENFDCAKSRHKYTVKEIRNLITGIYCVTKYEDKDIEEAFIVRGLRKQTSCYGLPGYKFTKDVVGMGDPSAMDSFEISSKIEELLHCDEADRRNAKHLLGKITRKIAPADPAKRIALNKYFGYALCRDEFDESEQITENVYGVLEADANKIIDYLYKWTWKAAVLDFTIDKMYRMRHPKAAAA